MHSDALGYPVDPNETFPAWEPPTSVPAYTGPPAYAQPPRYAPPGSAPPWVPGAAGPYPYRHVDPAGFPGGYPVAPSTAYPATPARPRAVQTAATLAFVVAGLLLASGFLIFIGSLAAAGVDDGDGNVVKLIFAGLANLVSGGLLIAGATSISNRRPRGRGLLAYATAICVATGILWLTAQGSGDLIWAAILCVPLIVATALALGPRTNDWLTTRPEA